MFNVIVEAISAINTYYVPGDILGAKDKTVKKKVFSALVKFIV